MTSWSAQDMDRARGTLLGLAIGDALGAPVEFSIRGWFDPVERYQPAEQFGLRPGQWTDDTSMALCLADSLLAKGGYDSRATMDSYLAWYRHGVNSARDICFDIGCQTQAALEHYEKDPILTISSLGTNAGNGCIMRLAPAAIVGRNLDPGDASQLYRVSAVDTHNSPEAVEATVLFGHLLTGLMDGLDPGEALDRAEAGWASTHGMADSLRLVDDDSVGNGGYVRTSLAAAWWAFQGATSFRDAVLRAVNLGGDADTIGAIAGQMAGAHWGLSAVDGDLLRGLWEGRRLCSLADTLCTVERGVLATRADRDSAMAR